MIKQSIKYTDFNGMDREEDFYFHLSIPELTKLQAEVGADLSDHIQSLVKSTDLKRLLDFLERIILDSYGKKTDDGKSFIKSPQIRSEFEHSQAYAELFEKLLTNPDMAQTFGAGIADNGKNKKNRVEPKVLEQ